MTSLDGTLPKFSPPAWVILLLFAVLAYFPLFLHLDTLPLRIWDEARQALNAYEMWQTGDLLVTRFNGAPEMWSTKPPLLIWFQALLYWMIGPGELAVRLPATIAAFLVVWFMVRAIQRTTENLWLGVLAGLVLLTSEGFFGMHMARSGDYDTPVMLFMTLGLWALYRWIYSNKPHELILFFLFLALGVLTKSVQAVLFVPGILLFMLWQGKLLLMLKQRAFWAGAGLFFLLVGTFYLARESVNPGYLQAVSENELGGRYLGTVEAHDHLWNYYIFDLIHNRISVWWIVVPIGIMVGLANRNERIRTLSRFMVCVGGIYLLIISSAGTKVDWYSGPLYPICAVLVAVVLYIPFDLLVNEKWSAKFLRYRILPYVFLFLVFLLPYSTVVGRSYFPVEWPGDKDGYAPSHYLQDAWKGKRELTANVLCHDSYYYHLYFYIRLLNDKGADIRIVPKEELVQGQRVLAEPYDTKAYIEEHYRYEVIDSEGSAKVYRILGPSQRPINPQSGHLEDAADH